MHSFNCLYIRIIRLYNGMFKDISIAIIFKGFGIVSDQEIIQLIGLEDYIAEALTPCIYEAHAHQVYTQLQVNIKKIFSKLPERQFTNLHRDDS